MSPPEKDGSQLLDVVIKAVERIENPLLLFVIAAIAELIFLLLFLKDVSPSLRPIVYTACALPLLVLLLASFSRSSRESGQENQESHETTRIFNHSDSSEFVDEVQHSFSHAKRIVLVGTGLNVLHRDPIRHAVLQRASRRDCQLEIFLANPFSPSVETRLAEEQLGDTPPPVGRAGLIQRLSSLINEKNRLDHPESVVIKLFNHYPAFAFMIIDSTYFFYPYGYGMLGTFSPVIRLSKDDPRDGGMIDFLERQYHLISAAAVDPNFARGSSIATMSRPIAMCFVPPQGSSFYRFGTDVVGYDIWNQRGVQSSLIVENATRDEHGFHLVCTDGLYFPNPVEARLSEIYASLLIQQFNSFDLENLTIEVDWPEKNSISLVARDSSGTLEAIHSEFVCSIYRRAHMSESQNHAVSVLDQQRNALMSKRYKSANVFSAYRPYFPLLRNVSHEKKQSICEELRTKLAEQVPSGRIRVDKMAIISKNEANGGWHVINEMPLL